MFGEDECLRMIINNGNYLGPEPMSSFYTVTCESNDAEILTANVDDVYKLFKNEKRIMKFLKDEFIQKFPINMLPDSYFDGVFSRKVENQTSKSKKTPKAFSVGKASAPEPQQKQMPVTKNLLDFGIQNKANDILLNKTELDFRETIKEIVKDYPSTKLQRRENQKSYINFLRAQQTKSAAHEKRNKQYKSVISTLNTITFDDCSNAWALSST